MSLETLNRQQVNRAASISDAARNWRGLCALIQKAKGE